MEKFYHQNVDLGEIYTLEGLTFIKLFVPEPKPLENISRGVGGMSEACRIIFHEKSDPARECPGSHIPNWVLDSESDKLGLRCTVHFSLFPN